jgi:hypothetical protein
VGHGVHRSFRDFCLGKVAKKCHQCHSHEGCICKRENGLPVAEYFERAAMGGAGGPWPGPWSRRRPDAEGFPAGRRQAAKIGAGSVHWFCFISRSSRSGPGQRGILQSPSAGFG